MISHITNGYTKSNCQQLRCWCWWYDSTPIPRFHKLLMDISPPSKWPHQSIYLSRLQSLRRSVDNRSDDSQGSYCRRGIVIHLHHDQTTPGRLVWCIGGRYLSGALAPPAVGVSKICTNKLSTQNNDAIDVSFASICTLYNYQDKLKWRKESRRRRWGYMFSLWNRPGWNSGSYAHFVTCVMDAPIFMFHRWLLDIINTILLKRQLICMEE